MNNNSFLFIFIFLLIYFILSSSTTEKKHEPKYNYFKNVAEIKTKIWYDPVNKTELAAMAVVTKRYVKKFWKTKTVEESAESTGMSWRYPLRLANGEWVWDTNQLPYYLK